MQCARAVILMGQDGGLIAQALGQQVPNIIVDDMAQAVDLAHAHAMPGDLVLLSPACASFDAYSGFEARGDDFTQLVQAL